MRAPLFPRMRAARRECPPALVELDHFPLNGEKVHTVGATPVPSHAIPFVRTDGEISEVEPIVDAAARLGDQHAEGWQACMSWLRGQRATSELLGNYSDEWGRLPR